MGFLKCRFIYSTLAFKYNNDFRYSENRSGPDDDKFAYGAYLLLVSTFLYILTNYDSYNSSF